MDLSLIKPLAKYLLIPLPLLFLCIYHNVHLFFFSKIKYKISSSLIIDFKPKRNRQMHLLFGTINIFLVTTHFLFYAHIFLLNNFSKLDSIFLLFLYSCELILAITLTHSLIEYSNWKINDTVKISNAIANLHLNIFFIKIPHYLSNHILPYSIVIIQTNFQKLILAEIILNIFLSLIFSFFPVKPTIIEDKMESIRFISHEDSFIQDCLSVEVLQQTFTKKFTLITLYKKKVLAKSHKTDVYFHQFFNELYEEFNTDDLLEIVKTNRLRDLSVTIIQQAFNSVVLRNINYLVSMTTNFLGISDHPLLNEILRRNFVSNEHVSHPSLRYLLNKENPERYYSNIMAIIGNLPEHALRAEVKTNLDFFYKGHRKQVQFSLTGLLKLVRGFDVSKQLAIEPNNSQSIGSALNIYFNEEYYFEFSFFQFFGVEKFTKKRRTILQQIFITKSVNSKHEFLTNLNSFEFIVFFEATNQFAVTRSVRRNYQHTDLLITHLLNRVKHQTHFASLKFPVKDKKNRFIIEQLIHFLNEIVQFEELTENIEAKFFLEIVGIK